MNVLQSFESSKSIRQSAQCKIQICLLEVPRNVVTALHAVEVPPLKLLNAVQVECGRFIRKVVPSLKHYNILYRLA
jgi:hypothetical protein